MNKQQLHGLTVLRSYGLTVFVLILAAFQPAEATLINGGFESPSAALGSFSWINESLVPGWETTATDGNIEIWNGGFGGVTAHGGNQHAEINATQVGQLYQDVAGIAAGNIVGFQFAHRGRYAVADVMAFTLTDLGLDNLFGTADDTTLFTNNYSDSNTAWGFYTGTGIMTLGNTVRFAYQSISSGGGVPDGGNFLDSADFGIGVGNNGNGHVPEPSTTFLIGIGMMGLLMCHKKKVTRLSS